MRKAFNLGGQEARFQASEERRKSATSQEPVNLQEAALGSWRNASTSSAVLDVAENNHRNI